VNPMLLPHSGKQVFFWNVDGAVGERGENRPEDVALVQFYYYLLPENRALLESSETFIGDCRSAVGSMNGVCTDSLINLIRQHQQHYKLPLVDGRVSRATPNGQFTLHGSKVKSYFMILQMMTMWRTARAEVWPRIDAHPDCPPLVRAAVLRTFG
jgi:hypothetical protein